MTGNVARSGSAVQGSQGDSYAVLARLPPAVYLGTHPDAPKRQPATQVYLRVGGVDAWHSRKPVMARSWNDVTAIDRLDHQSVQRRATIVRFLVLGPLALLLQKQRRVSYLVISDARGDWMFAIPGVNATALTEILNHVRTNCLAPKY